MEFDKPLATVLKKSSINIFQNFSICYPLRKKIQVCDELRVNNGRIKFWWTPGWTIFFYGWRLCFCFFINLTLDYQVQRVMLSVCMCFSQSHVTFFPYLLSLTRLPLWLERMVAVWLPCCCHTAPRWAVIGPPLGCKRQRYIDRQVWPPAPPPPLNWESGMPRMWQHLPCAMPNIG